MGSLPERISAAAGVPQMAAELLRCQISAAAGQQVTFEMKEAAN